MKSTIQRWAYGLGAACISGGASAVVSGLTTMGFAPDKFNLTTTSGFGHLMLLMILNFVFSAFVGGMFYLKQSPLPPENEN